MSQNELSHLSPKDVLSILPTLFETSSVFFEAPHLKGVGEDLISGKLLSSFHHLFAILFNPIIFKSIVRIAPPLQWKGGMLTELYKNKGSTGCIDNYRDVFLGDYTGKSSYKILRRKLIPLTTAIIGTSQYGAGFNGGETAFAHLYVRLLFDYARAKNLSASALYVNVTTAFATLLRRILFDSSQGDERWYKQLADTGFSASDINSIIEVLSKVHVCYNDEEPLPALFKAFLHAQ